MAAIAGAPLVHVFSLRERGRHYHFFAFPPQRLKLPRRVEREAVLGGCATRFAHDLESVLGRDPLQWYNFYPFWERGKIENREPKAEGSARGQNANAERSAGAQEPDWTEALSSEPEKDKTNPISPALWQAGNNARDLDMG
jgi:hypothetical protein